MKTADSPFKTKPNWAWGMMPPTSGLVAIFLGGFNLLGWSLNSRALTNLSQGFQPMKPNAAFCFLLTGMVIAIVHFQPKICFPKGRFHYLVQALGLTVLLIGLWTMGEHLFGLNGSLDQLLFRDFISNPSVTIPGRVSIATCFGLACLGASMITLTIAGVRGAHCSQILALVATIDGIISGVAFIYGSNAHHGISSYTTMAAETAFLMINSSWGVLCLRRHEGIMDVITSPRIGGLMARNILPISFFPPFIFGLFFLQGQLSGLYGPQLGFALFATANVVLFALLTWIVGRALDKFDDERMRRKEEEQRRQSQYAAIVEFSNDAIISKDLNGLIVSWNAGATALFGYESTEIIGTSILQIIPADQRAEEEHLLHRILRQEPIEQFESVRLAKGGRLIDVSVSLSPIKNERGEVIGASKVVRDISERKRTLQKLEQSQKKYRFLADAMPQIVWTARPDGLIDYFNQRWFDYSGLARDHGDPGKWQTLFHPEDRQDYLKHWQEACQSGQNFETQYRYLRASDGTYRWFLARAYPMRNKENKILLWVGTSTDIEDQVQARNLLEEGIHVRTLELRHSKARLQAVLDSSTQVAIIAANPQGLITVFNTGAERMLGYKAEEVVGQHTPEIIHLQEEMIERGQILSTEFGRPIVGMDIFTIRASQGLLEENEWTFVRKDSSQLTVKLAITASRDEQGQINGYLGVAMDITARKQAEIELRIAKDRAEAADKAKSQFLANMSHEIRTPMNGILGFAEFLADGKPGPLNDRQKEYLGDILNSGHHLLQLINGVLDLARVESGKMELQVETFSLHQIVGEVCAVAQPMAKKKHIQLTTHFSSETLDQVRLDAQKIRQILYNLISNAIKFTGNHGKVSVALELCEEGFFTLQVHDSGIGIKQEDLKRLFKEFEQLESGSDRKFQGTGLGLALTRKMVELQGGSIEVTSELGVGSTFSVILPLAAKPATAVHRPLVK